MEKAAQFRVWQKIPAIKFPLAFRTSAIKIVWSKIESGFVRGQPFPTRVRWGFNKKNQKYLNLNITFFPSFASEYFNVLNDF